MANDLQKKHSLHYRPHTTSIQASTVLRFPTFVLHYVIAHIQGAILQGQKAFDSQYIDDWKYVLQRRCECYPQDKQWEVMSEMLTKTIDGQRIYSLDLLQFIKPMKRAPFDSLGLHNGLAGYIELQLHNNQCV